MVIIKNSSFTIDCYHPMELKKIFSSYYLAPIEYYFHLTQNETIYQDMHENFVKQTYRNRCYILSPNGIQSLTIPLVKVKKQKPIKDILISYDEDWRKIHWKSFEAAYRSSPYFEFYEDYFYPFYHKKKHTFLIDFNELLEQKIIDFLSISVNKETTTEYLDSKLVEADFRNSLSPKKPTILKFNKYIQVFDDRNEFSPNLSILDLLFNEGPNAINYLKSVQRINNV